MQPRRAPRRDLHTTAGFRHGERRQKVEILDLSESGARLGSLTPLPRDIRFFLKLPSIAVASRIVWVDGFTAGCEFLTPLHPAVLGAIGFTVGGGGMAAEATLQPLMAAI